MNRTKLFFSLFFFTALCNAAFAQTKNVNKAESFLKDSTLDKAREAINLAAVNEKTSDKAKTWYVKGQIYAAIAQKDQYKSLVKNPNDTAIEAFKKCLQIDPKYTSMLLTSYRDLTNIYANLYRDGAQAFNDKDYKLSYEKFSAVKDLNDYLYSLKTGVGAAMDTMAILNMSNAAYNGGEKDKAIPGYEKLASIGYKEELFIYQVLLQYYREHKDDAKYLATMDQAKKLFPDDKNLANEEISYYNETGKMDQLTKKLEDAVQKEPNNYQMVLNLAITYDNLANPKDEYGQTTELPANHDEMFGKAVESYKKAISLKPEDYVADFNLGLMYYNSAAALGRQLGKLGSDKSEQTKQDSLLKKQDVYLDAALPYLQKTFETLDAKDKLKENEMAIYKNAMSGLQGIYARKSQNDKYEAIKKKLDAADSKAE